MKNFSMILLMIVSMISCSSKGDELKELPSLPDEPVIEEPNPIPGSTDKIVVGYVTSWSNHEVKPEYQLCLRVCAGNIPWYRNLQRGTSEVGCCLEEASLPLEGALVDRRLGQWQLQ